METKIFKLNTPRSRVIRGFLVAYGKKSLGEIFNKIWPEARNHYGSTEDTEGTEFFLLLTQEILKEIFFKMLLRKKYIQLPGN